MNRYKNIVYPLFHALGVMAYIIFVAALMNNANNLFGSADTFWTPVAMLLLFTVSAAITGLLVLGRPAYLFLNGNKKDGIQFLFYTLGWLIILTLLVFALLVASNNVPQL